MINALSFSINISCVFIYITCIYKNISCIYIYTVCIYRICAYGISFFSVSNEDLNSA